MKTNDNKWRAIAFAHLRNAERDADCARNSLRTAESFCELAENPAAKESLIEAIALIDDALEKIKSAMHQLFEE